MHTLRTIKNQVLQVLYYVRKSPLLLFPKKVEKTVVVLGMGRSGTSVTANILVALGVDMGTNLLGKTEHNKKGHFENIQIENLNKQILKAVDATWDQPPTIESINNLKKTFNRSVRWILRFEKSKIWGWKDPRTVFTLPCYLEHIENPHYIVCWRNAHDVARSLEVRDGTPIKDGLAIYNKYEARLNEWLQQNRSPVIQIQYETLLTDPKSMISTMAEFLAIERSQAEIQTIAAIVDPSVSTTK